MSRTRSFKKLSFNFQIESRGEGTEQVIGSSSQVGVHGAKVEEGHVEKRPWDIFGANLLVNGQGVLKEKLKKGQN